MRSFQQFIRLAGYTAICGVAAMAAGTAQVQDHQYSAAEIQAGSRLYATQCQQCHGQNGDQISGIDLRRGQFRRVDVRRGHRGGSITTGMPERGMPPFKLQPAELDGIIAFIRAGFDPGGTAVTVGDAARGQARLRRQGRLRHLSPRERQRPARRARSERHRRRSRTPAALQRSLLDPTERDAADQPAGARSSRATAATIRGRRLNEDTFTVQLIDDERTARVARQGRHQASTSWPRTSPMPSFAGKLSADEMADLMAYLLSLKGP